MKFTKAELLAANPDPDGDDLWVSNAFGVHTVGILSDPKLGEVYYTPPDGFVGIVEVLHYYLTDGQYESNLGRVIVHVVPAESALECPPFGPSRTIPIASERVGDMVTAQYVELPESARSDHNFTGPFTVEFWMRKDRDWVYSHEPLITKGDTAWRVQRRTSTDKLAFDVDGLNPLTLESKRAINDRNWHHVAAVYDGRYKLLYIDGELDAWVEVTGTPATNNEPVWIGSNSQVTHRRFRGYMDEVRIWNYARSAVEIRENFTRSLTGYEPGLLTYYTFDEPPGLTVYNFAMHGTSEPGVAVSYYGYHGVWRPQLAITKSEEPINWTFGTRVVGSYLFYNESDSDGSDPAATEADDNAIDPNILPLLPGELASEANRSSYERGVNGVIIDIASPLDPNALSLEDFAFAFAKHEAPDSWAPAEPPASILVRPGAGVCGSTRVTLAWADYQADPSVPNRAVGNGWLRVTVRANEHTGLHHDDVFHFGSSIGDSDDAVFHPLDLRVGPYQGAGDAAVGLASTSHSEQSAAATVRLFIRRGSGDRIQLTIPAIPGKGGGFTGRILTAPTPTGPWSALPGGRITKLGSQEHTIEVVPSQEAAFYLLKTGSAAR